MPLAFYLANIYPSYESLIIADCFSAGTYITFIELVLNFAFPVFVNNCVSPFPRNAVYVNYSLAVPAPVDVFRINYIGSRHKSS